MLPWLTEKGVRYLAGTAVVCLVTVIVRCAVAYALVNRCLRETGPENRPAVLRGTAEVLRSLRTHADRREGSDAIARMGLRIPPKHCHPVILPRLIGAEKRCRSGRRVPLPPTA